MINEKRESISPILPNASPKTCKSKQAPFDRRGNAKGEGVGSKGLCTVREQGCQKRRQGLKDDCMLMCLAYYL